MSKAILVIYMPRSCLFCPIANILYGHEKCEHLGEDLTFEDIYDQKPDWCPLKPLPEYDSPAINPTVENVYYAQGWNDCIDEILKGVE